jgi:cell division septation protein DedD
MKNKDFREIQVSSSLLVVIFLGVLALGVFIFLLGVSVGKKQVGAAIPSQVVTQQIPEPVKEPPVKPAASDAGPETQTAAATSPAPGEIRPGAEAASKPPGKDPVLGKAPAAAPKPAPETKKPSVAAPAVSGLYYVQVAAYTDRAQAQAAAEKYRKLGYAAVVANPKPSDARTWYRVRLGGYPTKDKANSLLAKLNAGKKTDFRIVQD